MFQCRGCHLSFEVAVSTAMHAARREMPEISLAMVVDTIDADVLVGPFGRERHVLKQRSQDKRTGL